MTALVNGAVEWLPLSPSRCWTVLFWNQDECGYPGGEMPSQSMQSASFLTVLWMAFNWLNEWSSFVGQSYVGVIVWAVGQSRMFCPLFTNETDCVGSLTFLS